MYVCIPIVDIPSIAGPGFPLLDGFDGFQDQFWEELPDLLKELLGGLPWRRQKLGGETWDLNTMIRWDYKWI